jgi:hypothetical protein
MDLRNPNLGKEKINQIVQENQNQKEGAQLIGGEEGELIVNVTQNSILTAKPNPPLGYRLSRYLLNSDVVFDFVIGKSEVARLLAFMKKYFKEQEEN